jgi:hypothetical protein
MVGAQRGRSPTDLRPLRRKTGHVAQSRIAAALESALDAQSAPRSDSPPPSAPARPGPKTSAAILQNHP